MLREIDRAIRTQMAQDYLAAVPCDATRAEIIAHLVPVAMAMHRCPFDYGSTVLITEPGGSWRIGYPALN